jgi:hypothetical protein
MDVYINEMTSTVRALDSEALLNPQILERLTQHLIAKLKENQRHERTVKEEQEMRPSMTSRQTATWE